jgi:sec-independent protein translocase protein TatA
MVVGLIALLLFGKRLPEVMRSLGKGIQEFKKGMTGLEDEFNRSTYNSNAPSYHEPARPVPLEERPELTAPKFQPPTTAPTAAPTTAPTIVNNTAPIEPQQTLRPELFMVEWQVTSFARPAS